MTALVGPNGVGKTCLAKLIVGDFSPTIGTVRKSGAVAFFSQREIAKAITVEDYLALVIRGQFLVKNSLQELTEPSYVQI